RQPDVLVAIPQSPDRPARLLEDRTRHREQLAAPPDRSPCKTALIPSIASATAACSDYPNEALMTTKMQRTGRAGGADDAADDPSRVDPATLDALLCARHGDPFGTLGMHRVGSALVLRALLPGAFAV
ncbi:hypothetical protein RZS08_31715, partial [Arthrospira platensis SPKY1]|nr:hypothetical protein [Arthrospira platensis SPKY1]